VLIATIYLAASLSTALLVGAWNDDGVYTVLGKSLAEGHGYHSLHLVGDPVQVKYPPGFPVLLALLWRLTGSVDGVQRLVSLLHPIVIGVVAGLLWWLGRERFGIPRILLGAFVVAPLLFDASIQYFTIPLSEPWFMWAGRGSVTWYGRERSAQSVCATPPTGRRAPCALLAAVTAFSAQAIVLVVAVLAVPWLQKRSVAHRAIVTVAALGPLIDGTSTHHHSPSRSRC
jgi:hypothetical protein